LHSNSFECKTPKFLKNRQSLIFQKLAGSGLASAIPIGFLLKANWSQTIKVVLRNFAGTRRRLRNRLSARTGTMSSPLPEKPEAAFPGKARRLQAALRPVFRN
jgi:hypothetical protein